MVRMRSAVQSRPLAHVNVLHMCAVSIALHTACHVMRYTRDSYSGSIEVSKTFGVGSIPTSRASWNKTKKRLVISLFLVLTLSIYSLILNLFIKNLYLIFFYCNSFRNYFFVYVLNKMRYILDTPYVTIRG